MMLKNLLRTQSIILYLLCIPVFLLVGMYFAAKSGAAEGQGLAAGAIVLFNGIVAALAAFCVALVLAFFGRQQTLKAVNAILGLALAAGIILFAFRYSRSSMQSQQAFTPAPVAQSDAVTTKPSQQSDADKMALGFFKPNFFEIKALYFYGNPNLEKALDEHLPSDSIVFQKLENGGYEITYAPPWLVPEHMKLDYDLLYFELISMSHDFLEVTVNKLNGQTSYVSRYAGKTLLWPEFLMSVNTLEFPDDSDKDVRIKPLDHASTVNVEFTFLRPSVIRQEWLKADLLDDDFRKVGEGWVKWNDNGRLLLQYSLLS